VKIAGLFPAAAIAVAAAIAATQSLAAQKQYDPGASDTEIKIGHTMPYSGPASAYGIIGKTTIIHTCLSRIRSSRHRQNRRDLRYAMRKEPLY
jgi:hypothetical protein